MKPCQSLSPAANTIKRINATIGSRWLHGGVNCSLNTTAPVTCTAWPLANPVTASLSLRRSSCTIGYLGSLGSK
eukprot:3775182-Alexandrium_andersonii.AAC.1